MEENKTHSQQAPEQAKNQFILGCSIIFIASLFYFYQFMIRVSPGIMNDEIRTVLNIDAGTLGTLIGVYYWSYTFMQIPLGITMDRIGPRYLLCGAAMMCAAACFIFGNTTNIYIAGAARFMMGMGSACGLIGTIKLGTIWLEPKHVAKVTGFTILMGTLGASVGGTPLNLVLNKIGFEHTMELMGLIGVIIGAIIFISVRIHPPIDHHSELPDIYANQHPLADVVGLVRNPQAWIVAVYGMVMYIPITIIGVAWGVSFVERACNTSETLAASVVSMLFIGAATGSPIFALISDYFKSRRGPMLVGSILTSVIWFTVLLVHNIPISIMYVLFFMGGFAYTAKCLTFASVCEAMPKKISGTAIAFANMIVMSTGIIFHPLIGHLLDYTWDGKMVDGIKYYSELDYRYALMVIPIALAASGILLLFMRESHPESSIVQEYGSRVIDTDVL